MQHSCKAHYLWLRELLSSQLCLLGLGHFQRCTILFVCGPSCFGQRSLKTPEWVKKRLNLRESVLFWPEPGLFFVLRTENISHVFVQEINAFFTSLSHEKTHRMPTENLKKMLNRDFIRKNPAGTMIWTHGLPTIVFFVGAVPSVWYLASFCLTTFGL